MDRYLEIAREVLRSSRQPLSARQILRTAHQLQLMPRELYGRTPQKTMQARLASDILRNRSKSEFYRTGPGRFFLRALQSHRSAAIRYREYQAPLRAAQLGRFDVVAFPRGALSELALRMGSSFPVADLVALPWRMMRLYSLGGDPDHIPFRFHLVLFAEEGLLFEDQRPAEDGEMPRRTVVGLPGVVKRSDRSLFSTDEFGLVEAASRTLLERFELSSQVLPGLGNPTRWGEARALVEGGADSAGSVEMMVFIGFQCAGLPEIADAVGARSASGWLPYGSRPNDLDHFDRWSSRLLADAGLQSALAV